MTVFDTLDKRYLYLAVAGIVARVISSSLTIYAVAIRGAKECNPFMSGMFSLVPYGLYIFMAITFCFVVAVLLGLPYHYKTSAVFTWKVGGYLLFFAALLWLDALNDIFATVHYLPALNVTYSILTMPYHAANLSVTC